MEPYRIPKDPTRVVVDMPPGEPVERVLYLSTLAENHRGAETVTDLLAAAPKFLPVRVEGDGLHLLRKELIRWVLVEEPERAEWLYLEEREGSPELPIRCEFSEGDSLEGQIRAMTPEGERRVSDVVNLASGFLPLETPGGLYLVNLARVHTIRLLEEEHGGPR